MDKSIIPLSPAPLRHSVVVSAALVVLVCLVITFFFQYAVVVAPNAQQFLLTTLWVGMTSIWILGALLMVKSSKSTAYILRTDALVVKKKGLFGKGTERLYRYDTILSVNSTSRAHGAYGSLEIVLDQQPSVMLSGIVLPDEYARQIKKKVSEARSR